jgi:hypothetical protein
MSTAQLLRILYLGRKPKLVGSLRALMDERNATTVRNGANRQTTFEFAVVANQRDALVQIRTQPPKVVMVELEKKSASRARFCEIVRYRLPTAAILSVAANELNHAFPFDGQIEVPLVEHQIFATLEQAQKRCTGHLLQFGSLSLNIATRTVTTPDGHYAMTPKQCALLQLLIMRHNTTVTRGEIMQTIWETSYLEDTRTLDVHIRWLRQRIEPDPSNPIYLKTIRGSGYQLTNG